MTPGEPLASDVLVRDACGAAVLAIRRAPSEPSVVLGPSEQSLLAEMPWPLRRAEWLWGRLAAKELLRRAYGLEPSRTEVLPEASGAPAVWVDGQRHPVQLNLSHTRTWAVAAAAEFPVGVDVADDADGRRLPRIERRVMSLDEAAQCGAHLSEHTQAAVWAIKEAGLKLRVGGVFSPGARSVHILSLAPPRVADATMALSLYRLSDAAVALAIEAPGSPRPLSREQLEARYGGFCEKRVAGLDLLAIPPPLWPLLPYAEVWAAREKDVWNAPMVARDDLIRVLDAFIGELHPWVSASGPASPEHEAYAALRRAYTAAQRPC